MDKDRPDDSFNAGVQDLEAAPSGWLTELVPPPSQSIGSPVEFQRLLGLVQRQLRNGRLMQLSAGSPDLPQVDVLQLPLMGPWPDVVEADFIDKQGRTCHLFADCYHGTGRWQDLATASDGSGSSRALSNHRRRGSGRVPRRVSVGGPDARRRSARSRGTAKKRTSRQHSPDSNFHMPLWNCLPARDVASSTTSTSPRTRRPARST